MHRLARIAGVGDSAKVQLHALGGGESGFELLREVTRQAHATRGDGLSMDERVFHEHRDANGARAQIDDDSAFGALLFRQSSNACGFRRGDLVIGLNDRRVNSVDGLAKALGASPDGWRLSFQREGQVYNLAIQG